MSNQWTISGMNGTHFNDELLRKLAKASPPCITIALLDCRDDRFEAQKARSVEKAHRALKDFGVDSRPLLEPIERLKPPPEAGNMVVFRAPELFETISTIVPVSESVTVDDVFNIRLWLPMRAWDCELACGKFACGKFR